MHAVIVTVDIDASRTDEADAMLHGEVVPQVKQAPGFLSGTWMRSPDGARGRGVMLFSSGEAAEGAARMAEQRSGGPVTIRSAEVFEVIAQA